MAKARSRNNEESSVKVRKGVLAVATLVAFIMIGVAGAISVNLAIVVTVILAVTCAAMFENNRRSVQTNTTKRKKVAPKRKTQKTKPVKLNKPKYKKSAAPKIEVLEAQPVKNPVIFDLATMPNAVRPDMIIEQKTALQAANDEELEYYNDLSDEVVLELLENALHDKNIGVFVQPIMRLPQRKTQYFEMFARIRVKSGLYVPASRYMDIARAENMMGDVDDLLLMQCLEQLKHNAARNSAQTFFLNISSSTLQNTRFMKRLLGFIAKNRVMASRLVFEISQDDFDNMRHSVTEVLRGLGTLGCHLSLDHIKHHDFDLSILQMLKVRFIKMNASQLLEKSKNSKGAAAIWHMKRKLENNNIALIVEKIEDEKTLKELLDFDIHYGQGFFLGKPDIQAAYQKTTARPSAAQTEPKKKTQRLKK